ncbi:MAG: hypothetical protein ACYCW6_11755 [Candidatus Xenobia bacterium]
MVREERKGRRFVPLRNGRRLSGQGPHGMGVEVSSLLDLLRAPAEVPEACHRTIALYAGVPLLLQEQANEVQVVQLDLLGRDPGKLVPDVTLALMVALWQQNTCAAAGLTEIRSPSLLEAIVVDRGWREHEHVTLIRTDAICREHSGWCLLSGHVAGVRPDPSQLHMIPLYEVLRSRPNVVSALPMPRLSTLLFEGDHIVNVL